MSEETRKIASFEPFYSVAPYLVMTEGSYLTLKALGLGEKRGLLPESMLRTFISTFPTENVAITK